MVTVTVDSKGRFSLPSEIRRKFGIEEGDTLFIESDDENAVIHIAKAVNPFDELAEYAEKEYRAGRTKSLRAFAEERGITPDDG